MPRETLELLNELEAVGFTNAHFRKLHPQTGASIAAYRRVCMDYATREAQFAAGDNNELVRARLRFVRDSLARGLALEGAVEQATEIDVPRVHWSDLGPDEFNDFEERRQAACNFWGTVVWHALKTAARESEDFVLDLIDRASAAATEVTRFDDDRFLRQRFVSESVQRYIVDAQSKALPKANFWKGLRHEQVWPRVRPAEAIRRAPSEAALISVLREATACVVTKPESEALRSASHVAGWDRFHQLGLRVWDRRDRKFKLG